MALYINTNNKDYPITEQQIKAAFPNVSFPVVFVAPDGYAEVVQTSKPDYDKQTQKAIESLPVKTGNEWHQEWQIVQLTQEEIDRANESNKMQNKYKAKMLLKETDWTESDKIVNAEFANPFLTNQNDFLSYRSQVRAIAINPPTTLVEFPSCPNAQWSN